MFYLIKLFFYMIFSVLLMLSTITGAMADGDLAKQSQNPLGTIISVPFENNFFFGIGPTDATGYVLNMKPMYPANLGNWNLINRFVIPVMYSEGQNIDLVPGDPLLTDYSQINDIIGGSEFGLGDITYQAFLSPSKPGKFIWGLGGAFVVPTATEERYSSDKWSAGPALVGLTMPGKWVIGCLAQNVWSFAGSGEDNVNKFLFQYFVNYNLDAGWYLSSTPTITANWEADSDNRWMVPFGGGVGKVTKFGKMPVDTKLVAYWNAEKPDFGPDWSMQFTVKFLFPK
jgi:hypothetical protein